MHTQIIHLNMVNETFALIEDNLKYEDMDTAFQFPLTLTGCRPKRFVFVYTPIIIVKESDLQTRQNVCYVYAVTSTGDADPAFRFLTVLIASGAVMTALKHVPAGMDVDDNSLYAYIAP